MKLPAKLKPELAAISIIIIFGAVFFWPTTLAGRLFVTGDAIVYSYPLRLIAWEAIRNGSLPLWTPALMGGYPLLSMAQLGLGYPLTWGYLFLPGHVAEQVYVLAPFLLAPIFTYAFARALGRSRLAALLAGLSFGYGGMMAGGMAHNGLFTNAVMWLPLMLIAIERARSRPFLPCLIGASAAYAMSVLTGLGQGFVYAGVIALLYATFLSVAPLEDSEVGRGWKRLADWRSWKPLMVCAGGMALAAGVAAFQIFETRQAQRLSIRHELSYEIFSGGSFTASEALKSFFAPLYHFNYEVSTYVAALTGLLAITGAFVALRAPRANLRVFFWLGLAVLAFLLMMGGHTPLYRLAYHIPVINLFRIPWRHAFEWTFAVSILSAYGWDATAAFLTGRAEVRQKMSNKVIGGALIVACLAVGVVLSKLSIKLAALNERLPETAWLYWKMGYTLLLALAVWWGWRRLKDRWQTVFLAMIVVMVCFWEPFIIHTADGRRIERELKAGVDTAEWAHERAEVKAEVRHGLPRVFASLPGDERNTFPALRYFTKFDLNEKTAVERVELKGVAEGVALAVWKATLYDSSGDTAFPLTEPLPEHWRKVYDYDNVQIYENPRALPRAWLVPKVEIVNGEEALRRIRGESERPFNPREVALLEPVDGVKINFPQEEFETPAEARIASYEPNRLAIETVADKRAALVVSEINYPGWEATIDGQPATIYAANYLLRAVIVPEGKHRVEMRYTAPAARRGAIISALALAFIAGSSGTLRRKRRREALSSSTAIEPE
jgi:hypothetical protein